MRSRPKRTAKSRQRSAPSGPKPQTGKPASSLSELLASGEVFRGLWEAAPDALIMVDQAGQILLANPRAVAMFGYAPGELAGRLIEDLVPERFRGPHVAHREAYHHNPHTRPMGTGLELFARRRDGSEFPVEIALGPVRTAHGLVVTAVVRDISERKQLDELRRSRITALEEAQRHAEQASRAKSEFLASMSHELRTPLNSILGFSELMFEGKIPEPEKQKEFLGRMLSSGRHLLGLINDILDLAKVEAGRMEFRPEAVSLEALIAEVCGTMRAQVEAKQIVLDIELDPGIGELVLDPGRLKQVLYNYLSNAIKFTPPYGRVRIVAAPEGEDYFQIRVEDTGIGMAAEDIERLFMPFQQLDTGDRRRFGGTGLGLALTKKLVEAQGGQVGASGELGRGSQFYATLPRRPSRQDVVG